LLRFAFLFFLYSHPRRTFFNNERFILDKILKQLMRFSPVSALLLRSNTRCDSTHRAKL
jgi:hypothetical protein